MEKLKKKYGLNDPQDIKLHLVWLMLKQVVRGIYGDSPRNKKLLERYEKEWKRLEGR